MNNMDVKFFSSLFEGDCSNGIKLGMGLTGGDFWPRPEGCLNLYRNDADEPLNLEEILAVFDKDQTVLVVPGTAVHEAGCSYIYVLRRVNCCGNEQQSFDVAIKVEFDSEGQLQDSVCNDIFSLWVKQVEGSKIELTWYYCPIEQKNTCCGFSVYFDDGKGSIDYKNELSFVNYTGPGFYAYKSQILDEDKYYFCVKAVSEGGIEVLSTHILEIHMSRNAPANTGIVQSQIV